MTVLGPDEIARLLTMGRAVEAMRAAFVAHALGEIQVPPRVVLNTESGPGATLVMPAMSESGDPPLVVVKAVSVFPENARLGRRPIHGTVVAIDAFTGVPQALMEGSSLTAIRTAATCGLATDILSRPQSSVLAVFGSGVHARTQVQAMRAVRPLREVRIYNPNAGSARAMADEVAASASAPAVVRAVSSPAEGLDGADIACMATTSRVPVFDDSELPDGIHINAIGSFKPQDREVPGATVARARVVVDDRSAALEEAGDLLIPMSQGLINPTHIHCDLGSLVLARNAGRVSHRQVTLFKSVGLAVQDVAAAQAVLREARKSRVGERIDW